MTAEQEAVEVLAEARCTDVHGDAYTAPWCHSCRGWAATVAAALAAAAGTTREAAPKARTSVEWGIERSLPQWNNGEPSIEWCASVGMSHRYEYTAESVWGLAGKNPVYRRTRTRYDDHLTEPELVTRAETTDD